MTSADRLAEALRALLADPDARENAEAELERYDRMREREGRYRQLEQQLDRA